MSREKDKKLSAEKLAASLRTAFSAYFDLHGGHYGTYSGLYEYTVCIDSDVDLLEVAAWVIEDLGSGDKEVS